MTQTAPLPNLGTQQSPIALEDFVDANVDIRINWSSLNLVKQGEFLEGRNWVKDARKWKVDPTSGYVRYDGKRYVPIEWHAHFPAEHTLNGSLPKGEVHIVHINAKQLEYVSAGAPNAPKDWWDLLVLGVFLKTGRQPHKPFDLKKGATLPRADLLPEGPEMLLYNGSLTTPPYSENVTFGIFTTPMTVTAGQLKLLKAPKNSRELQARNRRHILRTTAKFGK